LKTILNVLVLILLFVFCGLLNCARVVTGDVVHYPTSASIGFSYYWLIGIGILAYLIGHVGISGLWTAFKLFFR
jgi:hypothetical protein